MDNEQITNDVGGGTTSSGSKMMWIILLIVILLIVGVVIFTRANTGQTSVTPTPSSILETSTPMPEESESTSSAETDVKEIIVSGSSFKFEPAEIKVKQGDRVRVVFNNSKGTHDFVLPDFNVTTKQLSSGQTESVEFVAIKKGSFEYYCSVGNHRQMGMKGMLIVE